MKMSQDTWLKWVKTDAYLTTKKVTNVKFLLEKLEEKEDKRKVNRKVKIDYLVEVYGIEKAREIMRNSKVKYDTEVIVFRRK